MSYIFSIACENTSHPDCISEKFYDCVVNDCIPITNAPGAFLKYKDSCIYLDFNKSIEELVQLISDIYSWDFERITPHQNSLKSLKERFIEGNLSLIAMISTLIR